MITLTIKKLMALALAAALTIAVFSTVALAQNEEQPKDTRTTANEGAAWLLSQISDENSKVHEYFSTRLNKSTSLDSTGFNWATQINPALASAIGLDENASFSWRIWQGGKGEGYNVFFTLTDISGANVGTKIATIVKVNSIEQQLIIGTATVADKQVTEGKIKVIQNFVETPGSERMNLADLGKKEEPATDTDIKDPINPDPATDTDIKDPVDPDPATDTDIKDPINPDPATDTDIKDPEDATKDEPTAGVVPSAPDAINGIPLGAASSAAEDIPLSAPQTGSDGTTILAIALIVVSVAALAVCLRKATK